VEAHLLLGKSEVLGRGIEKASILANVYEAMIGAMYMDSGLDPVMPIVRNHLETYLLSETASTLFDDHKSSLQAQVQKTHGISPRYQVMKESGPDHDKRFQASVLIGGEVKGVGWGKSKKEAEQEAAKKALEEIITESQAPNDSSNDK
jgi:ribonuclease-3